MKLPSFLTSILLAILVTPSSAQEKIVDVLNDPNADLNRPADRALLQHPRDSGRAAGARLLAHLPLEDVHQVADLFKHIFADEDITYHSYHNMVAHTEIISLLANHRIQEGLDAALAAIQKDTGKYSFRERMFLTVIPKYGSAALPLLPKLRELQPSPSIANSPWNEMLKNIESTQGPTETIRLDQAIHPKAKN